MMKTTKIFGSMVMAAVLAMGTMTGCGGDITIGSEEISKIISEATSDNAPMHEFV